jgi:hypothetical protein
MNHSFLLSEGKEGERDDRGPGTVYPSLKGSHAW